MKSRDNFFNFFENFDIAFLSIAHDDCNDIYDDVNCRICICLYCVIKEGILFTTRTLPGAIIWIPIRDIGSVSSLMHDMNLRLK